MFDRRKMIDFLKRQIMFDKEEYGRCTRVVLRHVSSGGKLGNEIETIIVPASFGKGDKGTGDFIEDTTSNLEAAASNDAAGIGGVQSYCVHAYFKESKDRPLARHTFRHEIIDDEGGEVSSSEPPNKTGLTSQLMRHLDSVFRTAQGSYAQTLQMQQRMVNRQSEQIETFMVKHIELIGAIEGLMTLKHERDLDFQRESTKQKIKFEMWEKLQLLLPIAINRINKGKMLPEKSSSKELLFKGLIQSLTKEQAEKLQAALSPEQMAVLLELLQEEAAAEAKANESASRPAESKERKS
jgi:hypothetical protein